MDTDNNTDKNTVVNFDEKRLREGVRYLRENGIKPNQGGFWLDKHIFLIGKRKIKAYIASGTTSLIKEATLLGSSSAKSPTAYADIAEILESVKVTSTSWKDMHGHTHHYSNIEYK